MVVVDYHLFELIEPIYKHDHPNEDSRILAQWQMAKIIQFKIYITFGQYVIFSLTPIRLSSSTGSEDEVLFDLLICFSW